MKTISLSVSEQVYEQYRRVATAQGRPIAQLVREAMASFLEEKLDSPSALEDIPVLAGHRPVSNLPSRDGIYDEIFGLPGQEIP